MSAYRFLFNISSTQKSYKVNIYQDASFLMGEFNFPIDTDKVPKFAQIKGPLYSGESPEINIINKYYEYYKLNLLAKSYLYSIFMSEILDDKSDLSILYAYKNNYVFNVNEKYRYNLEYSCSYGYIIFDFVTNLAKNEQYKGLVEPPLFFYRQQLLTNIAFLFLYYIKYDVKADGISIDNIENPTYILNIIKRGEDVFKKIANSEAFIKFKGYNTTDLNDLFIFNDINESISSWNLPQTIINPIFAFTKIFSILSQQRSNNQDLQEQFDDAESYLNLALILDTVSIPEIILEIRANNIFFTTAIFDAFKSFYNEFKDKYEGKFNESSEEIEKLTNENSILNQKFQIYLQERLNALKQKTEEDFAIKIAELNQEKESLRQEFSKTDSKNKILQQQFSQKSGEYNRLTDEYENFKEKCSGFEEQSKNCEASSRDLRDKIGALIKLKDQCVKELNSSQEELSEKKTDIKNLKLSVKKAQNDSEAKKIAVKLADDLETLKSDLNKSEDNQKSLIEIIKRNDKAFAILNTKINQISQITTIPDTEISSLLSKVTQANKLAFQTSQSAILQEKIKRSLELEIDNIITTIDKTSTKVLVDPEITFFENIQFYFRSEFTGTEDLKIKQFNDAVIKNSNIKSVKDKFKEILQSLNSSSGTLNNIYKITREFYNNRILEWIKDYESDLKLKQILGEYQILNSKDNIPIYDLVTKLYEICDCIHNLNIEKLKNYTTKIENYVSEFKKAIASSSFGQNYKDIDKFEDLLNTIFENLKYCDTVSKDNQSKLNINQNLQKSYADEFNNYKSFASIYVNNLMNLVSKYRSFPALAIQIENFEGLQNNLSASNTTFNKDIFELVLKNSSSLITELLITFENESSSHTKDSESFKTEKEKLDNLIKSLQDSKSELESKFNQFKQESENLKSKLQQNNDSLSQQNENNKKDLESKLLDLKSIQEDLVRYKTENDSLKSSFQTQLENSLKEKTDIYSNQIKELNEKLARSTSDETGVIKGLTLSNQTLNTKIQDLNEKIIKNQKEIEDLVQNLEECKQTNEAKDMESKRFLQEKEECLKDVENQTKEIDTKNQQISSFQNISSLLLKLKEEVASRKQEISSQKTLFESEIKKSNLDFGKLLSEKALSHQNALTTLNNQNKTILNRIEDQCKKDIQSLKTINDESSQKLDLLQQEHDKLKSEYQETKLKLETQIQTLNRDIKSKESKLQDLILETKNVKDELLNLSKDNDPSLGSISIVKGLDQKFKNLVTLSEKLQQDLEELTEQRDKCDKSLTVIQQNYFKTQEELSRANQSSIDNIQKIKYQESLLAQIEELKLKIADLESQNKLLVESNKKLKDSETSLKQISEINSAKEQDLIKFLKQTDDECNVITAKITGLSLVLGDLDIKIEKTLDLESKHAKYFTLFESSLEKFNKKLESLTKEKEDLEIKIQDLTNLKLKFENNESQINDLLDQIVNNLPNIDNFEPKIDKLSGLIQTLNSKIDSKTVEIEKLKSEIDAKQKEFAQNKDFEIQNRDVEIQNLKSQNSATNQTLSDCETKIKQLQLELTTKENLIAKNKSELDNLNLEIERLNSDILTKENECLDKLKASKDGTIKTLSEQFEKDKQVFEKDLQDLRSKLTLSISERDQRDTLNQKLNMEAIVLEANVNDLQSKLAESEKKVQEKSDQIKELNQKSVESIKLLQESCDKKSVDDEGKINTLTQELTKLNFTNNQFSDSNLKLIAQLSQLSNLKDINEQQNKDNLDKLTEELQQKELELANLKKELIQKESEIQNLKTENDDFKKEIDQFTKQIEDYKDKILNRQNDITDLKDEIDDKNKDIAKKDADFNIKERELVLSRSLLIQCQADLTTTLTTLTKLEVDYKTLDTNYTTQELTLKSIIQENNDKNLQVTNLSFIVSTQLTKLNQLDLDNGSLELEKKNLLSELDLKDRKLLTLDATILNLGTEIVDLKSLNTKLDQKFILLDQDYIKLQSDAAQLKSERDGFEAQNNILLPQITDLTKERDDCKLENSKNMGLVDILTALTTLNKTQIDQFNLDITDLNSKTFLLNDNVNNLTLTLTSLSSLNTLLRNQMIDLSTSLSSLSILNSDLNTANLNLLTEKTILETKLKDCDLSLLTFQGAYQREILYRKKEQTPLIQDLQARLKQCKVETDLLEKTIQTKGKNSSRKQRQLNLLQFNDPDFYIIFNEKRKVLESNFGLDLEIAKRNYTGTEFDYDIVFAVQLFKNILGSTKWVNRLYSNQEWNVELLRTNQILVRVSDLWQKNPAQSEWWGQLQKVLATKQFDPISKFIGRINYWLSTYRSNQFIKSYKCKSYQDLSSHVDFGENESKIAWDLYFYIKNTIIPIFKSPLWSGVELSEFVKDLRILATKDPEYIKQISPNRWLEYVKYPEIINLFQIITFGKIFPFELLLNETEMELFETFLNIISSRIYEITNLKLLYLSRGFLPPYYAYKK